MATVRASTLSRGGENEKATSVLADVGKQEQGPGEGGLDYAGLSSSSSVNREEEGSPLPSSGDSGWQSDNFSVLLLPPPPEEPEAVAGAMGTSPSKSTTGLFLRIPRRLSAGYSHGRLRRWH